MNEGALEGALARIARDLVSRGQRFALVGGMAVSIRGEVRFTRDVDVAIVATSDSDTERLVRGLVDDGYVAIASVEDATHQRLSTVRLRSPSGVVVDLLAASSGIEAEVVARAERVTLAGVGDLPVARAEDLLALKILFMTDARPQDRLDAEALLAVNTALDLAAVRELLALIAARGFDRRQDLPAKLAALLAARRAW